MRFLLGWIFAMSTLLVTAQMSETEAVLSFVDNHHDFGNIYAKEGKVSCVFEYENRGTKPLLVMNVRSTCGCTAPRWTKKPVLPGQKGKIVIEYDPGDHQGRFHKTIQVQSTARNENMFVSISGTVLREPAREDLHFQIGELGLRSRHLNFGFIYNGDTVSRTMLVANLSSERLFLDFDSVPEHIHITANPPVLEPGQYGYIESTYFSGLINDWDVIINRIPIILNGTYNKDYRLPVTANLREDFRDLSEEQIAAAPVARFTGQVHQFGVISDTTIFSCRYKLTNVGESDLIIRAVKPSCGCTAARPEDNILAPGEFTYIEASFDPRGKKGNVKNTITVITNDPKDYKQYLYMEGTVLP